MKKYLLDLRVTTVERLSQRHVLVRLTSSERLPMMRAGQFVEVRIDASPSTFLRRPISINHIDSARNELWLLVAEVGEGTRHLAALAPGDTLNCLLPLGNGFSLPDEKSRKALLVGGGVGVAPLLFLGETIRDAGGEATFLLGARTATEVLEIPYFERYGNVHIATEDGTLGERGFVTNHSILQNEHFDRIYTCGPKPMMLAVARYAGENGITCEASLENHMACGLGACLCCVEKTVRGNVCVCSEGPVFNVKELLWQI